MIACWCTRDEIASSLSVSPETVKLHTRNILSKFGATTVRDGVLRHEPL
ncbi:MAG: hypothetical protein GYB46_07630 [Rhodobacteraceae bacterium]|nr:hypothetical protein [Paracoccaceae bacterium]